MTFFDNKKFQ